MAKAANIALLVLLIISPAVYAVNYTVGGNSGWTNTVPGGANFYTTWASAQNYTTADSLVFNFAGSSHDVIEVNQADYVDCDDDRPIASYLTGPVTVPLTTAGTKYFICSIGDHCEQGQKLTINVTAAATTPGGAPPPSANGPSPPSAGTPGTPSTPPPPTGGAASIVGGKSSLIAGFSLVLAAAMM